MKYRLGDLAQIKYGKDHKKIKDGNIPVYGTGGLMRKVNEYLYNGDSVLIPRKGSLNNVMYVTGKFWTVDTMFWTQVNKDKVLPKYLYYCLSKMDLEALNVGSAVPSLTIKILNEIVLDIPSLDKQVKIINKFKPIEEKMSLNTQINDNLSKLQQLNLSQLINRKLYKIVKIGGLEIIVSDHVANGSFKSLKDNVSYFDNPNYALFIRNIDFKKDLDGNKKYIDKKSYNYLKKSHLFGGEVVISNVADVGSVHRVPFIKKPMVVGNNQIFIKSKHFSMTDYLYVYFQSFWGQSSISSITSGSAQQKFNKTDFRSLKIPIPSEKWILSNISPYVTLQDKIFNENQSLKQIKATLLNHCF